MNARRIIPVLTLILAGVSRPGAAGGEMTLDDLLGYRTIDELRVSPDGRQVVAMVTEALVDENRFESDLYLAPINGASPPRRLTTVRGREASPRFAPDGSVVAFIAGRGGPAQVWSLPVAGGEARVLTAHPEAVAGFEWAPNGVRLLYVAEPGETAGGTSRREPGDDARVLGRQWRNQRLYIAPAGPGSIGGGVVAAPPVPATDGRWHVREDAAWSADGQRIAWIATPTAEPDAIEEARIQVLDVATGAIIEVPGSDRASSFAWAPAGGGLYFVRPFDGRGWSREDLHLWEPGGGAARTLSAALDRDVEAVRFSRDRAAVQVLYSRGVVHEVAAIEAAKPPRTIWRPGYPVDLLQSAEGGWVYLRADRPDEIWFAGPSREPRRLTRFNATIEEAVALPRIVPVSWSSDGRTIEGVLTGATPSSPGPLLVRPHGGPRWLSMARFDPLNAWLAARGYHVLEPNFRGSTGYGDTFAKANQDDWGAGPFADTMAGVEAMIARGIADPDRLFLYGWSYGGIMANWAATHSDRFRAIVSGAGVADLRMQYVLSDARRWRFDYLGGSPFTGYRQVYEKNSPVTYVGAKSVDGVTSRTPVLFIQGEADDRCPLPQALMMHRALLDAGRESELVIYPREGHGFREPRHILDRARRVAGWLAAHDSATDTH